MAKVKFQVDGFDANQTSIFNQDVTFDGNIDVNSITIAGVGIATAIPTVPAGGTTGQVLSKVDGTNYNTQWATVSGGAGGGIDPTPTVFLLMGA